MRFAISVPQVLDDGTVDPAWLGAHLRRAEALGFHSAWTQEHIFGTPPLLAPSELLAYAAACTDRLRLGCAVFVTPLHNPIELAKSISTLDQLSRGRLEVGVAIGRRGAELSSFGVDPDSMVARFTEGLRLMKGLWTEPRLTFEGRFWQLDDVALEPKPLQEPHPPVWFGGSHPSALRRAVRLGDGFFGAGSTTTADFTSQVRVVREALAELGRDPAGFPIAKRVYVAVDDDGARAQTRLAVALDRLYGATGMIRVGVYGPPEACVRGLREVADAGAELILLTTLFDDTEQIERLAADVIPALS